MDRSEDIKGMIQREIQSIPALDERVAFKDMMEGVFLSLYEKIKRCTRHWKSGSWMTWHMISTVTGSAPVWWKRSTWMCPIIC